MISAFMRRPAKVILRASALIAVSAIACACGTMGIRVPRTQANAAIYHGAVLFSQRCSGCHTLSYAGTHGSASNVRTAMANNGPNFNVRCERPITRVLYAIQNGGFSGAIMPQNIVVGQQAIDVAQFVSTFAGHKAPKIPGVPSCEQKQVGAIPTASATGATSSTGATGATGATGTTGTTAAAKKTTAKHAKHRHKP